MAYLHYGLFDGSEVRISAAKRCSLQLVLEHLTLPSCHISQFGIGLASMLVKLKQLGYQVAGITPDAAQVKLLKEHFGTDMPMVCTGLEDFSAPAESFDVILFQQCVQHISPLDIFTKASEFLVEGGEILILDEFALSYADPGKNNLHLLDHFIAMAGRFGFEVVEQLDLFSMAVPTLDFLLAEAIQHRSRLDVDLDLSHALLRLKKISVPRWRLSEISEPEHTRMLALFKSCFGQEMSSAHWGWKYADGRGQAIGVWQDNELIAHYGGTTRDMLYFGQLQKGLYPCDVMVRQQAWRSLSRKSPFFLMTATFLESYLGYGARHIIGLGFPNDRANILAKRFGFYNNDEVDHMVEISWPPATCKPRVWTELRRLNRDDFHSKEVVDQLWQRMASDFMAGIIGVRDWDYFKHRYFDHPDKHYQVFLVRSRISKRSRGLIVCRHHARDCELLDLVGPLAEIRTLIDQARKITGCLGADRLFCWTAAHYSSLFECFGGKPSDLGISIPTNSWTPGPPLDQIRHRCWLMGGDTDFR